jgi:hypothetical protein
MIYCQAAIILRVNAADSNTFFIPHPRCLPSLVQLLVLYRDFGGSHVGEIGI